MRIAKEEIFGPVLSIIPFENEEEAIKITNDTEKKKILVIFFSSSNEKINF